METARLRSPVDSLEVRLALALASVLLAACSATPSAPPDLGPPPEVPTTGVGATAATPTGLNPRLMRRFKPLAPAPRRDPALLALGRTLFHDPRLSADGDMACSTCHPLDDYGVDRQPRSLGHDGQPGLRNAPSVYNTAGQIALFWDGRAPTLVDQAGRPILDPTEMAMADEAAVVAVLAAIPGYVDLFRAAYPDDPDPVTFAHVTEAIGAFEDGLRTPARWDRFLRGDRTALTARELEGFRLFADIGCVGCHTGDKLGGSSFQRAGRIRPWPDQRDGGRWRVTHAEADRMVFKVPSLRNVARTAPYFHDGSAATLPEAIAMMADHQLGVTLTPGELELIVAWLDALTGELPADAATPPTLP